MAKYNDEYPDDDLEDVSVTSSLSDHSDKEWEYEKILAESVKEVDGKRKTFYLIKWTGWDIHESTWVAEDNLVQGGEQARFDWQHQSMREVRERAKPFDLARFEKDQKAYTEQKILRQIRKRVKRIRLGLPVKETQLSDDEESDLDHESSDSDYEEIDDHSHPSQQREHALPESDSLSGVNNPNQGSANHHHDDDDDDDDDDIPLASRVRFRQSASKVSTQKDDDDDAPLASRSSVRRVSASDASFRNRITDEPSSNNRKRRLSTTAVQDNTNSLVTRPPLKKTKTMPAKNSFSTRSPAAVPNVSTSHNRPQRPNHPAEDALKTPNSKRKTSWLLTSESMAGQGFKSLAQQNLARKAAAARADKPPPLIPLNTAVPSHSPEAATTTMVEQRNKIRDVANADPDKAVNKPSEDVPLTCWFWADNTCMWMQNCAFEHYPTGEIAPPNNAILKRQCTCYYWYTTGQCHHNDTTCKFSHKITYYLAPSPERPFVTKISSGTNPGNATSDQAQVSSRSSKTTKYRWIPPESASNHSLGPLKNEIFGCYFFNTSKCAKSEEDCPFPHMSSRWIFNPGSKAREFNPLGGIILKSYISQQPSFESKYGAISSSTSSKDAPNTDSPRDDPVVPTMSPIKTRTAGEKPQMQQTSPAEKVQIRLLCRSAKGDLSSVQFHAKFVGISPKDQSEIISCCQEFNDGRLIEFSHMLTSDASDGSSFFMSLKNVTKHAHGDLFEPTPSSEDNSNTMQKTGASLTAHLAMAISYSSSKTLVLFSKGGNWGPILRPGDAWSEHAPLRISLLDPLPQPQENLPLQSPGHSRNLESAQPRDNNSFSSLNFDFLFQTFKKPAEPVVFVIFHVDHQHDIEAFTYYLHQRNVKVYHSTTKGAWHYFYKKYCASNGNGGAILIHDSCPIAVCRKLANLQSFLEFGRFGFYRLTGVGGIQQSGLSKHEIDASTMTSPKLHQIFPLGLAVFIMDDCFAHQPHEALALLKRLEARGKGGTTPTFTVCRPDILDWVESLWSDEQDQQAASDDHSEGNTVIKARKEILVALFDLQRHTKLEKGNTMYRLYTPDRTIFPRYGELWNQDGIVAANHMAEWYSDWALDHVSEVRRFYLVTTERIGKRTEWANEFKHLSIMQPRDWMDKQDQIERRKRAKENEERKRREISAKAPPVKSTTA